jgi:type II secretory pathway component PulF
MRKVTRRDWLALSAPAIASILMAYFHFQQKGWGAGIATGAIMFAGAVWLWRRQIIKYPEETWKARL